LRRQIDHAQSFIADLASLDNIGGKIVSERSSMTVNLEAISWRVRTDPAEFEHTFRAVFKAAQHSQQIGNDDFVALPDRIDNFSACEGAGDIAQPALQHLHV